MCAYIGFFFISRWGGQRGNRRGHFLLDEQLLPVSHIDAGDLDRGLDRLSGLDDEVVEDDACHIDDADGGGLFPVRPCHDAAAADEDLDRAVEHGLRALLELLTVVAVEDDALRCHAP